MYGDEENEDLRVDEREVQPPAPPEDQRVDERIEETPPTPDEDPEGEPAE